jgi:hypothetical protein
MRPRTFVRGRDRRQFETEHGYRQNLDPMVSVPD